MVVVPTMLLNAAATDDLLEQLEIRYLANRDSNLHFALLTDLRDAPQAVMPTNLDCATLYNRRVALMRGQVDANPTDFMGDPRIRTSALLGTVWMPAFAYLPFRTVQQFREQQKRPQLQADLDALRAASAAQRCFEH